jgi:hypothetical protein
MLKKLGFSILFLTLVVVGFAVSNSSNRASALAGGWACKWENSGKVHCVLDTKISSVINQIGGLLDSLKLSPSEIPLVGGLVSDGADITKWDEKLLEAAASSCPPADCDDFFYDPGASQTNGYPTFCGGGKVIDSAKCLHFATNNPLFAMIQPGSAKISADGFKLHEDYIAPIGGLGNTLSNPPDNKCGVTRPGNCDVQDADSFSGSGLDTTTFVANVEAMQSAQALKDACENKENGAPLPFITCPIFNGIVDGISQLIGGQQTTGARDGILIDFLTINPLTTTSGTNVMQSFVQQVVNAANLVYIVVFLMLIFSSSLPLGLDNYTIKKMLPKFIAAVILTQFSFVICQLVIDFFNLLGTLVPNIIFALGLNTVSPSATTSGGGIIGTGLQVAVVGGLTAGTLGFLGAGGWILLIILAIIAIIAVLVGFVYIVLRYLVIYILVAISPLAFVTWVLPGTEKFFMSWWKNFLRINAVFPMITGMLATAIVLSQVLVASNANGATKLVAMLIPIVALFMIPKTLKWTTQGMNALAAGALGFAAGKMGAGARAVGRGAQAVGRKGYNIGKEKSISFGKRKAAERGIGLNKWVQRERGRQVVDARKDADLKYGNLDLDQTTAALSSTMAALARNPRNLKLQGDAQAGLDRLIKFGGAGRRNIGLVQNVYRTNGGTYQNWTSILGDAGIYGDLDEKAPELTLDWSAQAPPAGAPPGTPATPPAALFNEDGLRSVDIVTGTASPTVLSSIDLSKKGATELGKLGSTTVQSMAEIDPSLEATQYGQYLNWQAAATMASTPQLHPTDATTIQYWQTVGRRGVQYWENVGTQAAAAGDQALFNQAIKNQQYAQTIVDGFGG